MKKVIVKESNFISIEEAKDLAREGLLGFTVKSYNSEIDYRFLIVPISENNKSKNYTTICLKDWGRYGNTSSIEEIIKESKEIFVFENREEAQSWNRI